MSPVALLLALSIAFAQDLRPGQVIPEVKAASNPAQSYALYLPANYTPARAWPLILAFDPGGRGITPVERYRQAAEQYGFIVAGSNNSRNGSRDNDAAVETMAADVLTRFRVNEQRVYTAGMSGGARVALGTALASSGIAGVIASSAGFPDGKPRASVPFLIFATAGTEDFNHLELRRVDAMLTSPHFLRIFEGGHTWLSSELAVEAVEWMEVQAVRAGTMPKDAAMIARLFEKRTAAAAAEKDDTRAYLMLKSIVEDFAGLTDVAAVASRVQTFSKDPKVVAELRRGREEDNHETDVLLGIKALEAKLTNPREHAAAIAELARQWKTLSEQAAAAADSFDRRLARRVIGLLGSTVTTKDADYLKIIGQYRLGRGRP